MKNILVLILLISQSNMILAGSVDVNIRSNVNKLFNWAEVTYPDLFQQPSHTQYTNYSESEWCFRAYPGNVYAGVICEDGGSFTYGDVYTFINNELNNYGSISQFTSMFNNYSDSDSSDNGLCVDIPFTDIEGATETLKITYDYGPAFSNPPDMTDIKEYLSVTDTSTTIKRFLAIVGQEEYFDWNTDIDYYHIQDNYLFSNRSERILTAPDSPVITTTNVPGMDSTIATVINLAYKSKPVNTFCEGQTWTAGAYYETTSGEFMGMSLDKLEPTPGYTGTISSINQSVTVPAGTFNTVQLDYTDTNGDTWTDWISTDIGALVKSYKIETINGQKITASTELINLQR